MPAGLQHCGLASRRLSRLLKWLYCAMSVGRRGQGRIRWRLPVLQYSYLDFLSVVPRQSALHDSTVRYHDVHDEQ